MRSNPEDFFSKIGSFDHTLGIYLTYTLDREVIDKIRDNSSGRTVILHDYQHGAILSDNRKSTVVCIPAAPEHIASVNCFHSKLALLIGRHKARLLIGSANLTKASFALAKEICCAIDVEYDSAFYKDVAAYLSQIHCHKSMWREIVKEAIFTLPVSARNGSRNSQAAFIYNSKKKSISEQLYEYSIREKVSTSPIIRISSPFLSKDLGAYFDEFIQRFNPKEIQLYLRSKTPLSYQIKKKKEIKIFHPKKKQWKYHVKIVMLDYGTHAIIYLGSANFTRQGFFYSLSQNGNEECGVILKVKGKDRKEIVDWFKKEWINPVNPSNWQEDNSMIFRDKDSLEPYAFAERKSGETNITVYVYIPDSKTPSALSLKVDDVKHRFIKGELCLYTNSEPIISAKSNIRISIPGDGDFEVEVFDEAKFDEARKCNGDSLFLYENSVMDSVSEPILRNGIKKEGITVDHAPGVQIVEPPLLEQLYHNVRNKINHIRRRPYLSKAHLEELTEELKKQKGGTGLYFISHLYKVFRENKGAHEFYKICLKKIDEISRTIPTNPNRYKKFIKKWSQIKHAKI